MGAFKAHTKNETRPCWRSWRRCCGEPNNEQLSGTVLKHLSFPAITYYYEYYQYNNQKHSASSAAGFWLPFFSFLHAAMNLHHAIPRPGLSCGGSPINPPCCDLEHSDVICHTIRQKKNLLDPPRTLPRILQLSRFGQPTLWPPMRASTLAYSCNVLVRTVVFNMLFSHPVLWRTSLYERIRPPRDLQQAPRIRSSILPGRWCAIRTLTLTLTLTLLLYCIIVFFMSARCAAAKKRISPVSWRLNHWTTQSRD